MRTKKVKRSARSTDVKGSSAKSNPPQEQRKSVRGRKLRTLEDIIKMPADVIREITTYLFPLDILHLSWVSKTFHDFLLQRSSAGMWKHSLGYLELEGLPPCPDALIEPAWITFMLTPWCTGCGKTNTATETHWNIYSRFCKTCSNKSFVRYPVGRRLEGDKWGIGYDIPRDALPSVRLSTGMSTVVYLKTDVTEFVDSWEKLLQESADDDTKTLFIGRRVVRVKERQQHASSSAEWAKEQTEARKSGREDLKKERFDFVVSKLRELGWGAELDFLAESRYALLWEQKQLRVAKKVTDRVWKNMEGDMIECMEQARDMRLAHELRRRVHSRWGALKAVLQALWEHPKVKLYGPRHLDIALMPEVRDIVCAPSDAEVTEDSFIAVRAHFDEALERWKERSTEHLRALVRERVKQLVDTGHGTELPADVDPLDLAATRFACEFCASHKDYYYPAILTHRHYFPSTSEGRDVYLDVVSQQLEKSRMPTEMFVLDKIAVKDLTWDWSQALFKLCGVKDSIWPTVKVMDALDVRLVSDEKELMTWRAALSRSGPIRKWRLATPDEVVLSKEREREIHDKQCFWTCSQCEHPKNAGRTTELALIHLQSEHDIKSPTVDHELIKCQLLPESDAGKGIFCFNLSR